MPWQDDDIVSDTSGGWQGDPIITAVKEKPSYPASTPVQQMLSAPVKGATAVLGLPSMVANTVTDLGVGGASKAMGDKISEFIPNHPTAQSAIKSVASVPSEVSHYIFDPASSENLQSIARNSGIIPADPNYKAPTALGRGLDTVTEYGTAGLIPGGESEAAASGISKLGAVLLGGGGAAVAREYAPDSPIVELGASLAAPGLAFGGKNALSQIAENRSFESSPEKQKFVEDLNNSLQKANSERPISKQADPTEIAQQATDISSNSSPVSAYFKNLFTGRAREAAGNISAAQGVSDALNSEVLDKDQAIKNLQDAPKFENGGYLPTTGQLSNDKGLLSLQAADRGPQTEYRAENNHVSTNKGIQKLLAPNGEPAETSSTFFKDQNSGAQSRINAKTDSAIQAVNTAEKEHSSVIEPVQQAQSSTQRADASLMTQEAFKKNAKSAKSNAKELYSKVDPNAAVTFNNTSAAANDIVKSAGKIEKSRIPQLIKDIAKTRKPDAPSTFNELQSDLRVVNREIKNLRATDPDGARLLIRVKDGINSDMESAGSNHAAIGEANTAYRNYAQTFKSGPARGLDIGTTPASQTIDKFMANPEGAQQLRTAIGDDAAAHASIKDWFMGKLGQKAGMNPSPDNIRKFINENDSKLAVFPEVKNDLETLHADVQSKSGALDTSIQNRNSVVANSKISTRELQASPGYKFSQGDPVESMHSIMFGGNSDSNVESLFREAVKDKSGKAVESLKNAARQAMQKELEVHGNPISSDNSIDPAFKTTISKTRKFLDSNMASKLFTTEELGKMRQYSKQFEIDTRKGIPTRGASTTAEKTADLSNFSNQYPWMAPGAKLVKTSNIAMKVISQMGMADPAGKARQLMTDAMMTPKLAEVMLMQPNARTIPKIEKGVRAYFAAASEYGQNSDRKNYDSK